MLLWTISAGKDPDWCFYTTLDAYSEPRQTSELEINYFLAFNFFTKSFILDLWQVLNMPLHAEMLQKYYNNFACQGEIFTKIT